MAKKRKGKSEEDESKIVQQEPVEQAQPEIDNDSDDDDDAIEVNDPGDCIGHWAECEECQMCEIEESCRAMTKEINGGNGNAEEE